MKMKRLLHSLLPILLLSACTKPPEGTYILGGMKKKIETEKGSQIIEIQPWQDQETLTFYSDGKLSWSKVQKNGEQMHSKGQWVMIRDDAGISNIHATYNFNENKITYILGQRKNDDGEEELPLKYYQYNSGPERPVSPGNKLYMTSFTKVIK